MNEPSGEPLAAGWLLGRRAFLRLAGLSTLAAACGTVQVQPAATPELTATATRAPTRTAAPTATPTSTATPTATLTPEPTATPAPTSTPSPTATRGPLRVVSLIHGPYRALVVDTVLQRFGVQSTQIRVDLDEAVPDLRAFDAVVFAGGEQRPDEFELPFFQAEKPRILSALEANVPILGICLGHQLMSYWLGGQVSGGRWEIGWLPITVTKAGEADPLLAGLGREFHGFLWHGDQITSLPEEAVLLASTERCPVQAYRLGDRPAWGVQFNPQYDPVIAEGVIRAAPSLPKHGYDVEAMVATGYREYNDLAGKIFGNFLQQVPTG